MRYSIACVAVLGLAACAPGETETEVVEEPAVEEVAAAPGSVAPGNYLVTDADGETPFTMNEDGTWSGVDDEGNEQSGTSEIVDGKICFTTEGEEEANCWTNSEVAEDGSFTSVSDDGEEVSVRVAGG